MQHKPKVRKHGLVQNSVGHKTPQKVRIQVYLLAKSNPSFPHRRKFLFSEDVSEASGLEKRRYTKATESLGTSHKTALKTNEETVTRNKESGDCLLFFQGIAERGGGTMPDARPKGVSQVFFLGGMI